MLLTKEEVWDNRKEIVKKIKESIPEGFTLAGKIKINGVEVD